MNILKTIYITLPIYHTASFKGWKVLDLNVFHKYRQITLKYIEGTNRPKTDQPEPITIQSLTYQLPLFTLAKAIQKEIATKRLQYSWAPMPPLR